MLPTFFLINIFWDRRFLNQHFFASYNIFQKCWFQLLFVNILQNVVPFCKMLQHFWQMLDKTFSTTAARGTLAVAVGG
jgi:hypothetical protein